MKKNREITCLCDLIEIIKELPEGKTFWFRGHYDKEWPLVPSVQRECYLEREQELANDFYMRASVTLRDKPDYRNFSAWLSIMRHYGLPTRLLDWSRSPLIAAYFATEWAGTGADADACIWILDPMELNEMEGFHQYLYSVDSHTATQMIKSAFKKEYKPENPAVEDKILACYPIEHDMRIYVQQSAFTLHNTQRKLEEIPSEHLLHRYIIPAECKVRIAKELNLLGVTLSHIYPDAQNIARELVDKL